MNKIIRNIIWLLLENGSRILLAVLINGLLARALTIEQYGIIQYVLGLIMMFSSISFICGAEVVVPMLVNSKGKKIHTIVSNVFWLRFIFSILAYFSILLFGYYFEPIDIYLIIILMGLSLLVGESVSIISAWLQSRTNSRPRSIIIIISSLIKCSIIYILFYLEVDNIFYYAAAWVIESYCIAWMLYFIYRTKTNYTFNLFSIKKINFFLRKGVPFLTALLLMYLFLKLDIIFLKYYFDLESVAIYAAAFQFIASLSLIAPILSMSVAPSLIYKKEIVSIKKNILYIVIGLVCTAIIIAILFSHLSSSFIPFILGDRFTPSVEVFNLLVWAMIFHFANEGFNLYFIKINNGKLLIIKWLVVLLFSSAVYIIFIPKYGYLGAVIGYSAGHIIAIFYSIFILFFYNEKRHDNNLQYSLPTN